MQNDTDLKIMNLYLYCTCIAFQNHVDAKNAHLIKRFIYVYIFLQWQKKKLQVAFESMFLYKKLYTLG